MRRARARVSFTLVKLTRGSGAADRAIESCFSEKNGKRFSAAGEENANNESQTTRGYIYIHNIDMIKSNTILDSRIAQVDYKIINKIKLKSF